MARKDTTNNGYHYVECTECGAKYNAGRSKYNLGRLYESMDEWWGYHTGTIKMKYCKEILAKKDIPKVCSSIKQD